MTTKSLVTREQVQAYFDAFKKHIALKEEGWDEYLVRSLAGIRMPFAHNMATVAIQMHLFDVPVEKAEEDFTQMCEFMSQMDKSAGEQIYVDISPDQLDGLDRAVALVNSFIVLWNQKQEKA